MSYWIFVIKDTPEEFAKRMQIRKWPIFKKTQNRRNLRTGDKIIFYKAGANGKKFLGKALIASELEQVDQFTYSLKLSEIEVWEKPVELANVLNDLDFISDKLYWGRYFQGGVRSLSEKDYSTIVSKSTPNFTVSDRQV